MLSFQNPAAFLFLLFPPLLFILRYFKIFTKITFPAVLSDWNGKVFEWNQKSRTVLSQFSRFVFLVGYCACVTALADPVISHQEKIYTTLGTDMIFVTDTSPSMAAKDMNGLTRLEAAKATVRQIITENEGSRFGIVVLGSEASVFAPPTNDVSAVLSRLAEVNVGILGNGSAIGDGLSTAVCHSVSSKAPKKCIVLFTDGENNAGEIHPETAARLAQENGISVYVLGIGTKGTVPIEYTDPASGKHYSGYLESNYNSAALKRIAEIGGGRYFEVTTVSDLLSSLKMVAKTESTTQNFSYRTISRQYYPNVLFAAIICFAVAFFLKRIILREVL